MARVVLAMSGGVDSSVAAWLLREQGHDVIGLFMRHGQEPAPSPPAPLPPAGGGSCRSAAVCTPPGGAKQGCCSAADADDARRVADLLGIPFYAVNFQREFQRIVDYFVAQYTAGRTPNPCIVCNTWLKFGKLVEYADSVGAEFVATGHYARLTPAPEGGIALCRGRDDAKDQSYVLFGIERGLLPRLKFPVGEYRKAEIREIAGRLGLAVAAKRDSQEICFVPDQDHARFVREHRGPIDTSGEIVTTDGRVVGRHDGFERFTVGQRKGLRVALGEPRYVVRIEPDTHRVVLGTHDELAQTELTAGDANWLVDPSAYVPFSRDPQASAITTFSRGPKGSVTSLPCQVKIRYRSRPVAARVELLAGDRFRVCFEEPSCGVAPGQAAVCYDGGRLLGGGWID